MGFYIYDIIFLILFSLFVIIFLYQRRKNLKKEGLMYLYRTQVGVKFIDYVGKKYKKTLKVFGFLGVVCGYMLMLGGIYLFLEIVYIYLFKPQVVQAIKVPPIMPILPYFDRMFSISFLPPFYFTYWIIAIAVIAIFHEFSHGIIARLYNVKIKSTGFGFLGPFLAAFVEPDEKQMQKKPKYHQIAILSAGTFSNLVLAVLFLILLIGFFNIAYVPAGAEFNSYATSVVNLSSVNSINGFIVNDKTNFGMINIINENKINNTFILGNGGDKLNLTKISANNKTYYMDIEILKIQLVQNWTYVLLYDDLPAINFAMKGAIIQINNDEISKYEDLANIMKKYKPGDEIIIKTKINGNVTDYSIILGEDSSQKGRPMIGVGFAAASKTKKSVILGKIYDLVTAFKENATYYEPKYNTDFIIFIYNLIWWLALINLSVALMNMLPAGIFDGGRMFMLTIWAITGSKKAGEVTFKIITYIMLAGLALLMCGWVIAMF